MYSNIKLWDLEEIAASDKGAHNKYYIYFFQVKPLVNDKKFSFVHPVTVTKFCETSVQHQEIYCQCFSEIATPEIVFYPLCVSGLNFFYFYIRSLLVFFFVLGCSSRQPTKIQKLSIHDTKLRKTRKYIRIVGNRTTRERLVRN